MSGKIERKIRQASKRVAVPAMIEAHRSVNRLHWWNRFKYAVRVLFGRVGV